MAFAKNVTLATDKVLGKDYQFVLPDGYLPKAVKDVLRGNGFRFDWDLKCYKAPLTEASKQVAHEVKSNVENYKPAAGSGKAQTKTAQTVATKSLADEAKDLLDLGFTKAQVAKMIGDKMAATK
jgi:hypothetical protein